MDDIKTETSGAAPVPLNWVQQRAQREKVLDKKAARVWDGILAALQDAHDSYVFHYARHTAETEWKLEKINRVHVSRKLFQDGQQRPYDLQSRRLGFV